MASGRPDLHHGPAPNPRMSEAVSFRTYTADAGLNTTMRRAERMQASDRDGNRTHGHTTIGHC